MSQHSTSDLPTADSPAWPCPALPFLVAGSVWLAAVHAVSRAQAMEIVFVGASMLLLGAPIGLAGIYTSTLRRQYRLVLFRKQGWLYPLLSRRLLVTLFWTGWALATSFLLLLLRFHVYGWVEWTVLAATIPVFALVFAAIRRVLVRELRADAAVTEALVWSRRTCPALVLLLYVGALAYWGDVPSYASLDQAIEAHRRSAAAWGGSALVQEALRWGAYFDGLEAYALGRLGRTDSLWALLAMGAGNLAIFYNVCLALSCFRIPRAGFVQARLAPRSLENVFATAVVATFLVGFVYFPLLARLDEYVARSPDPARVRTRVERETTTVVRQVFERIDDHHYRQGTIEQLASARAAAAAAVGVAAERFQREVDAAFERLEGEAVGEYLDWYYSLPAEYGRIGMMLRGRLQDYLTEKARETFQQEKWYRGVETAFERMLSVDAEARAAYERAVRDILDQNRVDPSEHAAFEVTLTTALEDIVRPSLHQDVIPAAHRLATAGVAGGAGSAAAGGITFVIVQKVTAKVLGKQVLKLAAKAPLKAAVGKLAGGAAAGAAIGSLVPAAGTAVGAVVGGVLVGASIGVAVDGALLELEEALSRDDFERELVTAVQQARREFVDDYLRADVMSPQPQPQGKPPPGERGRQQPPG